jgi:hypothetical protein
MHYVFLVILLVLLGISLVRLTRAGIREIRSVRELEGWARRRRMSFQQDILPAFVAKLRWIELMGQGHGLRIHHVITGRWSDREVTGLDLSYEMGHGGRRVTAHGSLAVTTVSQRSASDANVVLWCGHDPSLIPLEESQHIRPVHQWMAVGGSGDIQRLASLPCLQDSPLSVQWSGDRLAVWQGGTDVQSITPYSQWIETVLEVASCLESPLANEEKG